MPAAYHVRVCWMCPANCWLASQSPWDACCHAELCLPCPHPSAAWPSGAMCCGCTKKKGNTTDTNTTATPTTDTPTPVSEDTGTGTGVTPSPSPSTAPTTPAAPAPAPAPAPATAELDEGADGVYLFAYTLVPTKAGEEELNATMYAAASAGRLLDSLETTAGARAWECRGQGQ